MGCARLAAPASRFVFLCILPSFLDAVDDEQSAHDGSWFLLYPALAFLRCSGGFFLHIRLATALSLSARAPIGCAAPHDKDDVEEALLQSNRVGTVFAIRSRQKGGRSSDFFACDCHLCEHHCSMSDASTVLPQGAGYGVGKLVPDKVFNQEDWLTTFVFCSCG